MTDFSSLLRSFSICNCLLETKLRNWTSSSSKPFTLLPIKIKGEDFGSVQFKAFTVIALYRKLRTLKFGNIIFKTQKLYIGRNMVMATLFQILLIETAYSTDTGYFKISSKSNRAPVKFYPKYLRFCLINCCDLGRSQLGSVASGLARTWDDWRVFQHCWRGRLTGLWAGWARKRRCAGTQI